MEAKDLNQELLEQYILAGSEHTTAEQLRVLAEHFCDKIRLRVAENPRTPKDVLRNLSHDSAPDVRVAVAANNGCDESLMQRLARDEDVIVRHGLAQNIDTPRIILEQLADDDNGWVRGEALKSMRILDSKCGDEMARRRDLKKDLDQSKVSDFEKRAVAQTEAAS